MRVFIMQPKTVALRCGTGGAESAEERGGGARPTTVTLLFNHRTVTSRGVSQISRFPPKFERTLISLLKLPIRQVSHASRIVPLPSARLPPRLPPTHSNGIAILHFTISWYFFFAKPLLDVALNKLLPWELQLATNRPVAPLARARSVIFFFKRRLLLYLKIIF